MVGLYYILDKYLEFKVGPDVPNSDKFIARKISVRREFTCTGVKVVVGNYGDVPVRVTVSYPGRDMRNTDATRLFDGFRREKVTGRIIVPQQEDVTILSYEFEPASNYVDALLAWMELAPRILNEVRVSVWETPIPIPACDGPCPWPIGVPRHVTKDEKIVPLPDVMLTKETVRFVGECLDGNDFLGWFSVTKKETNLPSVFETLTCVGDLRFLKDTEISPWKSPTVLKPLYLQTDK